MNEKSGDAAVAAAATRQTMHAAETEKQHRRGFIPSSVLLRNQKPRKHDQEGLIDSDGTPVQ